MEAATAPAAKPVTEDGRPSARYCELAVASKAVLEEIFVVGEKPSVESMLDWEYRGYNTSPKAIDLIRLRKFTKGLFIANNGDTYGYNTPIVQNKLADPWICKPSDENPTRFRFYHVEPEPLDPRDDINPHSLLLNYRRGGNSPIAIYNGLRNYLVRIEPGSDDLILGKAYYGMAGRRFHVNFFLMERHRQVETDAKHRDR
jgi:hypothetical protein